MRAMLALAVLVFGCDAPSFQSGHLQCAATGLRCPAGFHCAVDARCWRNGEDPAMLDLSNGPIGDLGTDDFCSNPQCECGTITTECGTFACAMPDCTARGEICNVNAAFTCGCPPPGRAGVYRSVDAKGRHCLSTDSANLCPADYLREPTPLFYGYFGDAMASMHYMNVCTDGNGTFGSGLTTCASGLDITGGLTQVLVDPLCGAVPVYRFALSGGGELDTLNPGDAPMDAVELSPRLHAWTTP